MSAGVDRLSASFENLAKSPPPLPTGLSSSPTPQTPASGDLNDNKAKPLTPAPAVQQKCEETTPVSPRGTLPPSTEQTSSKTRISAADRLLSRTGEATQSSTGAASPEKAPSKPPVEAIKPVANVMGREKTTGIGDNNTKKAAHPAHKSAKSKTSPEDKPQIGASKPEKVVTKPHGASDTKSDRETGSWGANDVLIVHDGTKHAHSEPTQPGSKRKHVDEPRPVTMTKGTGMTSPGSSKRSTDAAQPPLPPHVPKPPPPVEPPTLGLAIREDANKNLVGFKN